jgi:hypothetical protein
MAHLPFFRKGVIAANVNQSKTIYTQPLITEKFVEVLAALRVDAPIVSTHAADGIGVIPQISNDLVNWADKTPNFTSVGPGVSFPITETILITEIGRYMRFKIVLSKPVLAGVLGLTFSLLGDGKITADETLDAEYGFYDPAMMTPPLSVMSAPAPLVSTRVRGSGGGALATGAVIPGEGTPAPIGRREGPGEIPVYPRGGGAASGWGEERKLPGRRGRG